MASAYVHAASFDRFDPDHDGVVTHEEFLRDRAQARSQ
ncbi:MAG TPA: EF-hand domain-containing protein [Candidatus Eisenbacteria bacterium]|nr:EF-hand domain-containing protein [Candidatus Eisenbacteria bacterium]